MTTETDNVPYLTAAEIERVTREFIEGRLPDKTLNDALESLLRPLLDHVAQQLVTSGHVRLAFDLVGVQIVAAQPGNATWPEGLDAQWKPVSFGAVGKAKT